MTKEKKAKDGTDSLKDALAELRIIITLLTEGNDIEKEACERVCPICKFYDDELEEDGEDDEEKDIEMLPDAAIFANSLTFMLNNLGTYELQSGGGYAKETLDRAEVLLERCRAKTDGQEDKF